MRQDKIVRLRQRISPYSVVSRFNRYQVEQYTIELHILTTGPAKRAQFDDPSGRASHASAAEKAAVT